MDKATIRKAIKAKVKALSASEKQLEAEKVFGAIAEMLCFHAATTILLYHSLPDELPSHNFVKAWAAFKKVLLPRVNGDILEIAPFGELQVSDHFGIAEPLAPAVSPLIPDLVIVPAVAFDRSGNRLGRGKGYYDRLLPLCKNAYTLGVALDCQMVDSLPVESHDFPLDAVLTASEHIVINSFIKS